MEDELFGELHEQEENGLYGKRHLNELNEEKNKRVETSCASCKYCDGWKCEHPQGCEGDYELYEQGIS